MPRRAPAEILAVGMVTPIGLCAAQTAASVRTDIARLSESFLSDRFGEPLVMGLADERQLPPLAEELEDRGLSTRQERMARLAGPALAEALANLPAEASVRLLLGVPEPRAEARAPVGAELLELLGTQSQRRIDLSGSRAYPLGRASGLVALDEALSLLERSEADSILIGAVDSYLDVGVLEALDREGRLRTGEVSDGFIPGEAAAFLLLAPAGTARRRGQVPVAQVVGVGLGQEPGHLYSPEPHRGEGLASAFADLFESLPRDVSANPIECVYAGLNGESFWAKEWGVARIRSAHRFTEDARLEHPADCMGDVGAAMGPVMAGLAALNLARDRHGDRCLIWCASDREHRAAVLLSR